MDDPRKQAEIDYQENVGHYPVLSQVAPGDIRAALPAEPPEQGESFDAVLRDVDSIIMPGTCARPGA